MKHKLLVYILFLVMTLVQISCIDDKGNYKYIPSEELIPVEIQGLKDTSFLIFSEVVLEPRLIGTFDEEDYIFTWFTTNRVSDMNPRDTLGHDKVLRFTMTYPVTVEKVLTFEMKDKKTGYFINESIEMKSFSDFSEGWYILKGENGESDIDFFNMDFELRSDLFSRVHDSKIKGNPKKLGYQGRGYIHQQENEDGTVTPLSNLSALYIMTDEEIYVTSPEDFTIYKDFNSLFFATPEVKKPDDFFIVNEPYDEGDAILFNNGKAHTLSKLLNENFRFNDFKRGDFELFPGMIVYHSSSTNGLSYCINTHSFLSVSTWSNDIIGVSEPSSNESLQVSPSNMNLEMIHLIQKVYDYRASTGWAIMKSNDVPDEYYIFDIRTTGSNYPFVSIDTINSNFGIIKADVVGKHEFNNIYFGKGNKLSYYQFGGDMNAQKEFDVYTFAAGETIAFVEHVNSTWFSSEEFTYLQVLTNSNSGWTMYLFELEGDGLSPNIKKDTEPIVIKGSGNAKHAIYVAS